VETATGWGWEAHRRIHRLACTLVPGPLNEFVMAYQETLAVHAPDPDHWKATDPEEGYRHYIDADMYGSYPFSDLPRTLPELEAQYGREQVQQWGIGPWAVEAACARLTAAFQAGQWEEALTAMSALGHYVADLHMPLHVVANYNGQFTGNEGVHFRWETQMVDEFVTEIRPMGIVAPVTDPWAGAWEIVRESYRVHSLLLAADTEARRGLTPEQQQQLAGHDPLPFEKPYLTKLYAQTGTVAEERLGRAAVRVAAFWYTCWLRAGSPAPPRP
jgi:hypothetical protein